MKEVEPDYVQSSRSGPRRGVRCKDSASKSENDDNNSQDNDPDVALAADTKKSKKVAVRGVYDKDNINLITKSVSIIFSQCNITIPDTKPKLLILIYCSKQDWY